MAALDGRLLGSGKIKYLTPELILQTGVLHTESIRLFAIESPQNPIILGLPWLEKQNPRISWSTQQILQWSEFCQHHCLTSSSKSTALPVEEKPKLKDLPKLPLEYQDLSEAFSKAKASKLPPHRPSDCAIDLIPGSTPPSGRIFPLSQPESETMKQYIEEELSKGFIVPSKSPASAGFFFVKKMDGGLRPCIDYRALNDITVKFRYPLTLLPAALEQLRTAKYFTTIFTVIDRFSKTCRLIPLTKLPTAFETAEALLQQVYRFYGLPEDIVSDRGPQFTSRVWRAVCQQLSFNVSLSSGYHPESNGQVERLNQELTCFLRSYCHNNQNDWSRYLIWEEYAQNSLRKLETGLTPFQCVLGFQPPLFPWSGEPSELPAVNDWLRRSEETWNAAHVHIQRAVQRVREQADRRRRAGSRITPSQWVWLSTRNLRLHRPCKKLNPRYMEPFKILRQITPVSYRLALPANYRISPTFHVSLLKPASGSRGERDQEEATEESTPPIVMDGEETYQVREILDPRRRGRVLQYLIYWEGYGPEEHSWVNSQDILDPNLTTLPLSFTGTTLTDQHQDPVEDLGVQIVLASGAAHRGGSDTSQASVVLSDHHRRAPSPEY